MEEEGDDSLWETYSTKEAWHPAAKGCKHAAASVRVNVKALNGIKSWDGSQCSAAA